MDQHLARKKHRGAAFTIVELLVVIAIITVLAGIFFGVTRGVNERSRISRAETQLSLLAQYLDSYKAQYGDYPRVEMADSNSADSGTEREGELGIVELYNALNGMRGVDPDTDLNPRQRAYIDRSKFSHEFTPSKGPPTPTDPETAPVALIDPWGNAYRYYYAPPPVTTAWENPRYVLYAVGESGAHEPPGADGYPDKKDPKNVDNVYAN